MTELRYNPLLGSYVIHSPKRNNRPNIDSNVCPFCEKKNELPKNYIAHIYPNDFPALQLGQKALFESKIGHSTNPYGVCQVVLYSSDHDKQLSSFSNKELKIVVQTWIKENLQLSLLKEIKQVFIFENKGAEVGVTVSHPHGQIYAYPFVSPLLNTMLQQGALHFKKHKKNIFDDIIDFEENYKKRIIYENDDFIALIPFHTDYPFGLHIIAKSTIVNFIEFKEQQINGLVDMLHKILPALDLVFNISFPYMMCFYQSPVNTKHTNKYYKNIFRWHIQFFPPLRDINKQKYYASSEIGAGVATNPRDIDECAAILKSFIKIK